MGVGLAGSAMFAGTKIVELGVKMEKTRLSFQTMMGDVSKGNAVLSQLNEFANATPFSNDQLITSGKTLLAFGLEAKKLQDILRMVGDTSAGTGKDFVELSGIIGKSIAKGKADSETLNQLSEAGVPIVKTLGAMYNKTGLEIYKMAEKGQLTSDIIISAFQKMTSEGGMFEDMMSKQAKTTAGLWSTVIGKLQLTAATIGESVNPLLKIGLEYIMGWTDELGAMSKDGRAIQYLAAIGMTGVEAAGSLIKWFNRFYEYGSAVFTTLQRVVKIQFESIQFIITDVFVKIVDGALGAINALISAANEIPGVNIQMVEKPAFFEDVKKWAKMSREELENEIAAVASGKDFADASDNIVSKNKAIDETINKLDGQIGKWQAEQQAEIVKRQMDSEKYQKELNGQESTGASSEADGGKIKRREMKTDSLTKMGLYNFGAAIPSADMERNKLLKDIKELLKSPRQISKLA